MTSPRLLIAPDSFKGTMSAVVVAAALGEGVLDAGGVPDLCPVADGGEGTFEALDSSVPGHLVERDVVAPDGSRVRASYLLSEDGTTAVVETAAASGLHLIDPTTVDAYAATSAGTGELIAAVARAGARKILVGVGGSGFSDGGLGALTAIEEAGGLGDTRLTVLCDVATPYENSARVFSAQKGADADTVERLTDRLERTAASFPKNPTGVAGTGAAGGLTEALWAAHGAEFVSGIDAVLDIADFRSRLGQADAVLTGEGRLDAQTPQRKVIEGITRWARKLDVPVYAVVGQNDASADMLSALSITAFDLAGQPDQLRQAATRRTSHLAQSGPHRLPSDPSSIPRHKEVKTP